MTHAAIFDLDGTLVDTPRAIVEGFTTSFADLGLRAPEPSTIRATIGTPLEEAFAGLLGVPRTDELVARAVDRYQVAFREVVLPKAGSLVFPGVAEGLDALRAEGFALAVATSKWYASADALLKSASLRDYFDVVVGADQVDKPKPDPEMGWLVLGRLGIEADRAVFVGDTTHDLLMAKASGMRSIAVTYGVHDPERLGTAEPTWMAASFAEVMIYLREGLSPPDRRGDALRTTTQTPPGGGSP